METTKKRLDNSITVDEEIELVDLEATDINNAYYNEVLDDVKTSFDIDDEGYLILESLLEYYKYQDELHNLTTKKKEDKIKR